MKATAPELPACVVHESFPKRRKEGTSNTILAGIAITPDGNGVYRLFAKGNRATLPKNGANAQQALNFVDKMRRMCDGIVEDTPKQIKAKKGRR
jgi:hypothetical protein